MNEPVSVSVSAPAVDDITTLFNQTFLSTHNTVLARGGSEPIYEPAEANKPATIKFAHGFYTSALHEIAHWCVAGPERRQQLDYGYWYQPDGRSAAEQQAFEQVEVKPQALEWIFSVAAGVTFYVSCDNLSGERTDPRPFQQAVRCQALLYLANGLPTRAQLLTAKLLEHYGRHSTFAEFWDRVQDEGLLPNGP